MSVALDLRISLTADEDGNADVNTVNSFDIPDDNDPMIPIAIVMNEAVRTFIREGDFLRDIKRWAPDAYKMLSEGAKSDA